MNVFIFMIGSSAGSWPTSDNLIVQGSNMPPPTQPTIQQLFLRSRLQASAVVKEEPAVEEDESKGADSKDEPLKRTLEASTGPAPRGNKESKKTKASKGSNAQKKKRLLQLNRMQLFQPLLQFQRKKGFKGLLCDVKQCSRCPCRFWRSQR